MLGKHYGVSEDLSSVGHMSASALYVNLGLPGGTKSRRRYPGIAFQFSVGVFWT